ncbi:MFS transporter [Paraburkholderia madseniana]|uniref:MFS transporter n=1 Tax=Paraburkholderia madseniana TaxID=2599607 RepID=A0A6N6W4X8_9BURK|nr:MFS transporter [Paraburkholderia madseniana]KAE8754958.1 MFS transporter [Paraburkholderia madseniana]
MSTRADKREKLSPMARRALGAGIVGTLIEWYDYGLYGAASALILPKLFFPSSDPETATLAAFATFAVGFFARPVGGLLIANFGDRYGRKPVLVATLILMGLATTLMGLLPTFERAGHWAIVLLVILRMLQGAGAGAELAGAMTLVAEYAPPSRRAFVTAIPNGAASGGALLSTLAFLAVASMPEQTLLSWGWRVPFLLSAILFLVALFIRHRIEESPEFARAHQAAIERNAKSRVPLFELVKSKPRTIVLGMLSGTALNVVFYVLVAFSMSYMTTRLGISRSDSLVAMAVTTLVGFASAPIMGNIADHIGPGNSYRIGAFMLVVAGFPLLIAMQSANLLIITSAMALCAFFVYGPIIAGQGAFLSNLFPTELRFTGIAVTREFNSIFVAGPTPFIAAYLVQVQNGKPWLVSTYMCVGGLISVISISLLMRDARHTSALSQKQKAKAEFQSTNR